MSENMIFVGVLLIAAAAGFTIDVFVENSAHVDVDLLGRTFVVNAGWLVVAGVVATTMLIVGARLIVVGMARSSRRRAALRTAQSALRDRDRLELQLAAERAERDRRERAAAGQIDLVAHPTGETNPRADAAESPANPATARDTDHVPN